MPAVPRTYLRGVLVPDPDMSFWPAQSGEYSGAGARLGPLPQGGPEPGVPTAQQDTAMVLQSGGSQSRDKQLRIRSVNGGFAGRDGATTIYQYEGDSLWTGWDIPSLMVAWEPIVWNNAAASGRHNPHAVTLPDGTIIAHYQVGPAGTPGSIEQAKRNPTTGAWTTSSVASAGTMLQDVHPTLVRLPSGILLMFAWTEDAALFLANVGMWYSSNDGTSWTRGAIGVLPANVPTEAAATGYVLGRLRAAYLNGQILLMAAISSNDGGVNSRDILVQYASDDLGCHFVEIDRNDMTAVVRDGKNYQDIIVVDGKFMVFYLKIQAGVAGANAFSVTLGSAYESFRYPVETGGGASTGYWGTVAGSATFTDGDLAATVDEGGIIYVFGRLVAEEMQGVVTRSIDGGKTFQAHGHGTSIAAEVAKWFDMSDAATHAHDACAVWQQGRAVVIHRHASNPSGYFYGLNAAYLGGYSDVTMPPYGAPRADTLQVCLDKSYLPFDLPTDVGWTGVGAGAESNATGILAITAGAAAERYFTIDPGGAPSEGMILATTLKEAAGISRVFGRIGSATHGYEVRVDIDGTNLKAWDTVGAVQIGATATITANAEIQILIGLVENDCTVWWRYYSTGSRRQWTQLGQRLAMTDDAGGTFVTPQIRIGTDLSLVAQDTRVRMVGWTVDAHIVYGNFVGVGLAAGQANPSGLFPRRLSTEYTYVDDGVTVRASSGPTRAGEEWDIDTRYQYPVSNLLPAGAPSPAAVWRSCAITALLGTTEWLHLAWQINATEDNYIDNDIWGLYLDGLNCPLAQVDVYYGGAWHAVGGTGVIQFAGLRKGATVVADPGSVLGSRYRRNELVGAGAAFYSGGYVTTDWTGVVTANTEGVVNRGAGVTKKATFHMETLAAGMAASPAVGIWPRRHLIVVQAAAFSKFIRGIRIRLPVPVAAAYPGKPSVGYYEHGTVAFGPLVVFGADCSSERTVSVAPNVELTTARDGTRQSRVLGVPRRAIELSWLDGVDLTDYRAATVPSYLMGTVNAGADPIAFRYDTPLQVFDLVAALDGAHTPIVYFPSIDYDASAAAAGDCTVYGQDFAAGALYGRITSPVELTQVLGEEQHTEVYRIGSVTIEEEV